jgi:hypothetical protein
VRYLAANRDQVLASQANVPAAVNAASPAPGTDPIHYLRAITYFSSEGFVGYDKRLPSNRRNPYLKNRGLEDVRPGSVIKAYDCSNGSNPDRAPEPDAPPPCVLQSAFGKEFGGSMFPHLTRDAP